MKYRIFILRKNRITSEEAFNWCYDTIGSLDDCKWMRWTADGDSVFKFANESDYLAFLLKFGDKCEKNY